MNKEDILVTGGTGTVGSNIPYGRKISSKDCDLRDSEATYKLFSSRKFDKVIHCGAIVGGLGYHLSHPYELFHNNVMINCNVIDAARKNGVKRVLSFLSSCIYSDDAASPYTEEMIYEGVPSQVHYPYAYAKRMLAVQSKICFNEGLIYNSIVPTNIYGKNDDFNYERGHFMAALIRRAYESSQTGEKFVVWGDGTQVRDVIYTEDIVKLTTWAVENYLERDPLIFSSNNPVEIGYVAELIANKFGIKDKIVFDKTKPMGQKTRILSGNKLANLNKFDFTSIEEGVSQSVDWFLANYPNVRL